jgi:hypothetical protein
MNSIKTIFVEPFKDNFILFDCITYIDDVKMLLNDIDICTKYNSPLIILFNIYVSNEIKKDICKSHKEKYSSCYYTFSNNNYQDSGILILAVSPMAIHYDRIYPLHTERIARKLLFQFNNYQIRINMNSNLNRNGYQITIMQIHKNGKYITVNNTINKKVILIKGLKKTSSNET